MLPRRPLSRINYISVIIQKSSSLILWLHLVAANPLASMFFEETYGSGNRSSYSSRCSKNSESGMVGSICYSSWESSSYRQHTQRISCHRHLSIYAKQSSQSCCITEFFNANSTFDIADFNKSFQCCGVDQFPCRFQWRSKSEHRLEWHDHNWQYNFDICKGICTLPHKECRTPSGGQYHL